MVMEKMKSGVGSNYTPDLEAISRNKISRNKAISDIGESSQVFLGAGDPDQLKLQSSALENWHMVQVTNGNTIYNTIAYKDPQQTSSNLPAVYGYGDSAVMKKAGSGGTTTNNILPGTEPVAYDSSKTKMIQRRFKVYYGPTKVDPYFSWQVVAVPVPMDYELQEDERLDNGFYPPSQVMGNIGAPAIMEPYGVSFPVGPNGGLLYSPPPFDPDIAWSGTVYEVPQYSEYLPVIDMVRKAEVGPSFVSPEEATISLSDPLESLTVEAQTDVYIRINGKNMYIPRYDIPEGTKTYFTEPTLPYYGAITQAFAGPYPMENFWDDSEDRVTQEMYDAGYEWGTPSKPNIFDSYIQVKIDFPWDDKKVLDPKDPDSEGETGPFQYYDLIVLGIDGQTVTKPKFFKVVAPGSLPVEPESP